MHEHTGTELKLTATKSLVLVGQPNVGKSVMFNHFTGRYVTVSNYPGTTVEILRGVGSIDGDNWEIVDTPGVNSLFPKSEDERATRDLIVNERPRVIIQVADAKNLRRALTLTLELSHFKVPLVLALNMSDEASSRGIKIDIAGLSRLLGIPVVETVAITGDGLPVLRNLVKTASVPKVTADYPQNIVSAANDLAKLFPVNGSQFPESTAFMLLAEKNVAWLAARFGDDPELHKRTSKLLENIHQKFVRPLRIVIFEYIQAKAGELTSQVMTASQRGHNSWLDKVALLLMRPFPGYIFAVFTLWVMYEFVGVFAAGTLVDLIENKIFGEFISPGCAKLIETVLPYKFWQDFFIGRYGIISMALTYAFALILPIVSAFFFFFSLLEDSGYLPRLAVMMDRLMRIMGLNGKAVLPLVLGLGCDTMATLTTRTLETRKERVLVTLLLSLSIPCSAQLGVVFGMLAGLGWKVMAFWLFIVGGVTAGVGWVGSKVLPGMASPFMLEIPPLRRPELSNVLRKVFARLKWYLKEVVPLFVLATVVLFFLDRTGLLQVVINACSPVVVGFLGLPLKATEALIMGFFRRDYGAAGFYDLAKNGLLTQVQVLVSIVVITLFMPCVAQVIMTVKERGLKTAALIFVFVLTFSILVGGLVNAVLG